MRETSSAPDDSANLGSDSVTFSCIIESLTELHVITQATVLSSNTTIDTSGDPFAWIFAEYARCLSFF